MNKSIFTKIFIPSAASFGILASLAIAVAPVQAVTLNIITDTKRNFRAIVSGGDFDAPFRIDFPQHIENWNLDVGVEGLLNDTQVVGGKEIVVDALLQHIMGPHGEGPGFSFAFIPNWITNGQPFPQAPQPIVLAALFEEPHEGEIPGHIDEAAFIWSVQADGTDFVNWELEIIGRHIGFGTNIPEPTSTLSLLGLGTLGAASTLKRKLKSFKSTLKETTKVG